MAQSHHAMQKLTAKRVRHTTRSKSKPNPHKTHQAKVLGFTLRKTGRGLGGSKEEGASHSNESQRGKKLGNEDLFICRK